MPQRAGGAFQDAGVGHIKRITFSLEEATGTIGLFHACETQVDIGPAGESVFHVPDRFASANEDKFVHGLVWGIAGESTQGVGAF